MMKKKTLRVFQVVIAALFLFTCWYNDIIFRIINNELSTMSKEPSFEAHTKIAKSKKDGEKDTVKDDTISLSATRSTSTVESDMKMVKIMKMKKYREQRFEMYDTWFINGTAGKLPPLVPYEEVPNLENDADQNGTILDFVITGRYCL